MIPSLNIDHTVPALKLTDEINYAVDLMDEHKLFHLPVIEESKYLGYISEEMLLSSTSDTVDGLVIAGEKQFTSDNESLYGSLKHMSTHNLSALAVLGASNEYLGVITVHSIMKAFSEISSIRSNGGVFSLILAQNDYSIAELGRIIESNGYKILSVDLLTVPDSPLKIEVVFKLNSNDLSTAYAALSRYGYQINLKFGKDIKDNDNKDRIDQLINLLDL